MFPQVFGFPLLQFSVGGHVFAEFCVPLFYLVVELRCQCLGNGVFQHAFKVFGESLGVGAHVEQCVLEAGAHVVERYACKGFFFALLNLGELVIIVAYGRDVVNEPVVHLRQYGYETLISQHISDDGGVEGEDVLQCGDALPRQLGEPVPVSGGHAVIDAVGQRM